MAQLDILRRQATQHINAALLAMVHRNFRRVNLAGRL